MAILEKPRMTVKLMKGQNQHLAYAKLMINYCMAKL